MKSRRLHLKNRESAVENEPSLELADKFWNEAYLDKVLAPSEVFKRVEVLKAEGKVIVTTNGSFDLLHAGHLHTLYEGKKLGDVFIVALNTDASIRSYKGPSRPIIPLKYRLQMLAALSFVDFITYFDESDPRKLLKEIGPHVHVNSAEYGDNCIEKEVVEDGGGYVKLIEKIDGLSTSEVIKKIRACTK